MIALLVGPPLGLTPRRLLLWRHPLRDVIPRQRQQRIAQPRRTSFRTARAAALPRPASPPALASKPIMH